jgi:hypothetical protein
MSNNTIGNIFLVISIAMGSFFIGATLQEKVSYEAYLKEAMFMEKLFKEGQLPEDYSIYSEYVHVLCKSGATVNSLQDILDGRGRILIGGENTLSYQTWHKLLEDAENQGLDSYQRLGKSISDSFGLDVVVKKSKGSISNISGVAGSDLSTSQSLLTIQPTIVESYHDFLAIEDRSNFCIIQSSNVGIVQKDILYEFMKKNPDAVQHIQTNQLELVPFNDWSTPL